MTRKLACDPIALGRPGHAWQDRQGRRSSFTQRHDEGPLLAPDEVVDVQIPILLVGHPLPVWGQTTEPRHRERLLLSALEIEEDGRPVGEGIGQAAVGRPVQRGRSPLQ